MSEITESAAHTPTVAPVQAPSVAGVLGHQRKTIVVALVMVVASLWLFGVFDRWTLAVSLACGVVLGLLNHLYTEFWLGKVIASGRVLTKGEMARSTMIRLTVLTVVAVAIASQFWPDGAGVLFGLAVFRLIALVMTSIPLLKELKSA